MSDALLVLTVMESLLDHVLEVLAWLECWDLGLRDDDSCVCCDVSCCLLCAALHSLGNGRNGRPGSWQS